MNRSEDLMTELETELMEAMRRVDAPDGFADRVLARTGGIPSAQAKGSFMPHPVQIWLGGAVAATILGGAFWTHEFELRRQRLEAERAQQQFETAVQITDHALEHTRRQLQNAGIPFGE